MRTRPRKDSNHTDIIVTFRACGATVMDTASLGKGCPDAVIGYRGHSVLVEIKDGSKPPSQRKLTVDEYEFQQTWRGKYVVITSVDDVIELLRELA